MNTSERMVSWQEKAALIRPFVSEPQYRVMYEGCCGSEHSHFIGHFVRLHKLIDQMPKTYDQDGQGDASIVTLHYFIHGFEWFITEKDLYDGISQAWGYGILDGDLQNAELGYISIAELAGNLVELDLYFEPCSLGEVKAKLRKRYGG